MTRSLQTISLCVLGLAFCLPSQARAQRTVNADDYRGRLEGMWVGQMLGNYAGRQVEGRSSFLYEGSTTYQTAQPIYNYSVQWDALRQGHYYQKNSSNLVSPSRWSGDDDTCLEFLYAHALSSDPAPDTTALWRDHVSSSGLYIANKQAWLQINTYGKSADQAGSVRHNMHAGWAIDSQITTESLGAIAVGMRAKAAQLAGDFGGITNEGYSLHAAQFYAAMYAQAPFESNVETLVTKGLEVVPEGSWTREIITEAKTLYEADVADGSADNWLASRDAILNLTRKDPGLVWVESGANTGLTTLAILYGQGNFMETVEYGVRGGKDSDCNPATAGGLVGMIKGIDGIEAELTEAGHSPALPTEYDDSSTTVGLEKSAWTLDEVVGLLQGATEKQILAAGGSVENGVYSLPDAGTGWDLPAPEAIVSPAGPRGVVGQVLQEGGSVDVVVKRNGQALTDGQGDRSSFGSLIDGVVDLRYNGQLAFWTSGRTEFPDRPSLPEGETPTDAYELHFDQEILFTSVVFGEGDVLWSNINGDPSTSPLRGGYFEDLTIEILQDDEWVEVEGLALSESLDPLLYYQSIDLSFAPMEGMAIRLVGTAGGTEFFTSATEIEVFGVVPEPATASLLGLGALALLRRRRR